MSFTNTGNRFLSAWSNMPFPGFGHVYFPKNAAQDIANLALETNDALSRLLVVANQSGMSNSKYRILDQMRCDLIFHATVFTVQIPYVRKGGGGANGPGPNDLTCPPECVESRIRFKRKWRDKKSPGS